MFVFSNLAVGGIMQGPLLPFGVINLNFDFFGFFFFTGKQKVIWGFK